jgi:hypothetical protein
MRLPAHPRTGGRPTHENPTEPFIGDCPDFRGAREVALGNRLTTAKMGLSPSRRPRKQRI